MSNWEKNVRKVVPYVPGEQPHEADMIKLNTNENPYPPSPKAAEAIRRVAEEDTLRPVSYTHLTLPTICSV